MENVNLTYAFLLKEVKKLSSPEKAKTSLWFFKTGPGQYGEGDKFLGLTTPQMRNVSKKYQILAFPDLEKLLSSPFHEHRSLALQILVLQFQKAGPKDQKAIFDFYLNHTSRINNWDLVDISAAQIVGQYLINKNRIILYKLAKSSSLWQRRISIISTFTFIRHKDYSDTLKIAKLLLTDKEDLIHKAVGWMLREVGNRDQNAEIKFLDVHTLTMPRTMLRYAIEKFPPTLRLHYLHMR